MIVASMTADQLPGVIIMAVMAVSIYTWPKRVSSSYLPASGKAGKEAPAIMPDQVHQTLNPSHQYNRAAIIPSHPCNDSLIARAG
jgi:hypothetical protein